MPRFIISFCFLFTIPLICVAQSQVDFGLTSPLFGKLNTDFHAKSKAGLFGAVGFGAVLRVSGTEPQSLTFCQHVSIEYDVLRFQIAPGNYIVINHVLLDVNPAVFIPSKWEHIKYCVGIGGLTILDENVGESGTTNSQGIFAVSFDSLDKNMSHKTRKFVPYIALGIAWQLKEHIALQLTARQTLLNYFDADARFGYSLNYQHTEVPLSYQPLYFGLRFFYYF